VALPHVDILAVAERDKVADADAEVAPDGEREPQGEAVALCTAEADRVGSVDCDALAAVGHVPVVASQLQDTSAALLAASGGLNAVQLEAAVPLMSLLLQEALVVLPPSAGSGEETTPIAVRAASGSRTTTTSCGPTSRTRPRYAPRCLGARPSTRLW
jgi:hypothetical protein